MKTLNALTGIQPTNTLHIGNYFGALQPAATMQEQYRVHMMIVDLHAITVPQDPKQLSNNILLAAAAYLAAGIDPKKTLLFQQSRVPEHAELAWILQTITMMGEASRMTQFKDKAQKKEQNVAVGLFTYPILMAADILLYDTQVVPVGEDQKQHLELARDLAQRFNQRFGETFVVPDPLIRQGGMRIKSLQDPTKKMSKSDPSAKAYLSLLDDADVMAKKIRSAVTDSERLITADKHREGLYNLLTIFSLVTGETAESLALKYQDQGMKTLKDDLAEAVIGYFSPIQGRIHEILNEREALQRIIVEGSREAHAIAKIKMDQVKVKIGLAI